MMTERAHVVKTHGLVHGAGSPIEGCNAPETRPRWARARWPITEGRGWGSEQFSRRVPPSARCELVCAGGIPAAPRRPVPVSRVMIAEMIREDLAWVGSIGLIGREAETMGPRHGLCEHVIVFCFGCRYWRVDFSLADTVVRLLGFEDQTICLAR